MKFGQILSYYKGKNFAKKLVPDPFVFAKNQAQFLSEIGIFDVSYLSQICNSKAIKICPNQHASLLKFLFYCF